MSTPEVPVSADAVEVAWAAYIDDGSGEYDAEALAAGVLAAVAVPDTHDAMERALTAALPVLRAEWEEPLRELHCPVDIGLSGTICAACSTLRGTGSAMRYSPFIEWPCETITTLDALPGGEQAEPDYVKHLPHCDDCAAGRTDHDAEGGEQA